VEAWEEQLQNRLKCVLEMLSDDRVLEREQCVRKRRGNSWRRLGAHISAMQARLDAAKTMVDTKTMTITGKRFIVIFRSTLQFYTTSCGIPWSGGIP
jgi:hypothetical protein